MTRDHGRNPSTWESTAQRIAATIAALLLSGMILFALNPSGFIYHAASLTGFPAAIGPAPTLAPGVNSFDDYFAIERIDERTIAIGEPRYWQRNISYLILGSSRAVLFDGGPGIQDIEPMVRKLTGLPVVAVASHLHYDHVAGLGRFEQVAMLDVPQLRGQADHDGNFRFMGEQHLGAIENMAAPRFKIDFWLKPGAVVDLGARSLQVITTPGHSPESLMLLDAENRQLFTGDFIYPGALLAILPGAHFGQYMETAGNLVARVAGDTTMFPGHGSKSMPWKTPRLRHQDLVDLNAALTMIRDGNAQANGIFPRRFVVNPAIEIWAPFPWNMNWQQGGI